MHGERIGLTVQDTSQDTFSVFCSLAERLSFSRLFLTIAEQKSSRCLYILENMLTLNVIDCIRPLLVAHTHVRRPNSTVFTCWWTLMSRKRSRQRRWKSLVFRSAVSLLPHVPVCASSHCAGNGARHCRQEYPPPFTLSRFQYHY